MRTNCKRNAPTYLLIAFLIMQLNSRHEHRAIEDYMRSRFGPRLATAGATPATGAAVSSKAFSFNHSWITFRGFCNQWSELKAPRFSADKSKVATTARLRNVYWYAYIIVVDCAPFDSYGRPCKASRFFLRIIESPTPSRSTPE